MADVFHAGKGWLIQIFFGCKTGELGIVITHGIINQLYNVVCSQDAGDGSVFR